MRRNGTSSSPITQTKQYLTNCKIEVPYCLELNEEIKIYEKILRKSKFDAHIAPHTIEIAAMFAILTRLAPSNKVDPMTKLRYTTVRK